MPTFGAALVGVGDGCGCSGVAVGEGSWVGVLVGDPVGEGSWVGVSVGDPVGTGV